MLVLIILISIFIPPQAMAESNPGPPDPDTGHKHKMVDESFSFRSYHYYLNEDGDPEPFVGHFSQLVRWNGVSWYSSPVVGTGITDSTGHTEITTSEDSPGIYFYKIWLPGVDFSWSGDFSAHILVPSIGFNESKYTDLSRNAAIGYSNYGLNNDPSSMEYSTIYLASLHYEAGVQVIDKIHQLTVREGDMYHGTIDESLFYGIFPFTTTLTTGNDGKIYVSSNETGRLIVRNADSSIYRFANYKFCEPNFSYSPEEIHINDQVTFTAHCVNVSEDSIDWEFGDGQTDLNGNPIVNHIYAEPGLYTMNLSIYYPDGSSSRCSQLLNVTGFSGKVSFDKSNYNVLYTSIGSFAGAEVKVIDPDLDKNPNTIDDVSVSVYSYDRRISSGQPLGELGVLSLTLQETAPNSGIFTGRFYFNPEGTYQASSEIKIDTTADGSFLVIYVDEVDDTGNINQEKGCWADYRFYGTLRGKVWRYQPAYMKEPIVPWGGGIVRVYHKNGISPYRETTTDQNGNFIVKVDVGENVVEALCGGPDATLEKQVVTVSCGQDQYIVFPKMFEYHWYEKQLLLDLYVRLNQEVAENHVKLEKADICLSVAGNCVSYGTKLVTGTLNIGSSIVKYIIKEVAKGAYISPNPAPPVSRIISLNDFLISQQEKVVHGVLEKYWDPPDYNFTSIYIPTYQTVPSGGSGNFSPTDAQFINVFTEMTALDEAILISIERYDGAMISNKYHYAKMQLNALIYYCDLMEANHQKMEDIIPQIHDELYTYETNYGEDILLEQNRLEQEGFTPEELAELKEAGLTDYEIEQTRQFIINMTFTGNHEYFDTILDTSHFLSEEAASIKMNATGALAFVNLLPSDFLYLYPGWNFISVPHTLSAGNNTAIIFSDVNTTGKPIWNYNSSTTEWTIVSNDTIVKPMDAYWIYSDNSTNIGLRYHYETLTAPGVKHLSFGWNAIGLAYEDPLPTSSVLSTASQKWVTLLEFNNELQMYYPPQVNGISTGSMQPGRGYWIFMKEPGDLVALTG